MKIKKSLKYIMGVLAVLGLVLVANDAFAIQEGQYCSTNGQNYTSYHEQPSCSISHGIGHKDQTCTRRCVNNGRQNISCSPNTCYVSSCNTKYHQSGNSCVQNTCGTLPDNASWWNDAIPSENGASSYSATSTNTACTWYCNEGYHKSGNNTCASNTQTGTCTPGNATITNGHYNIGEEFTQTWSGTTQTYLPVSSGCSIICDQGFVLSDGNCVQNTNCPGDQYWDTETSQCKNRITYHTGNITYSVVCDDVATQYTGVGTITITDGTKTMTILDRNVGASETGYAETQSNIASGAYGCYFKWGNNTGIRFEQIGQMSATGFNELEISNSWSGGQQGPCPVGFHIATSGEWLDLIELVYPLDSSALWLPKIGAITNTSTGIKQNNANMVRYWTSTPLSSDISAYMILGINPSNYFGYSRKDSFATPLRCMYNKYEEYSACVGDTHMNPVTLECEANVKTGDCALGMGEGNWIKKEVTYTRNDNTQTYDFEECESYAKYSCN